MNLGRGINSGSVSSKLLSKVRPGNRLLRRIIRFYIRLTINGRIKTKPIAGKAWLLHCRLYIRLIIISKSGSRIICRRLLVAALAAVLLTELLASLLVELSVCSLVELLLNACPYFL